MNQIKKCKINTSSVLKQIINERDSPLSIFREAISNSFDAKSEKMYIYVNKNEKEEINIVFEDDGEGMNIQELEQFFNAGYTNKDDSKIGEKGLGTKLFFNSEKIEIITKKEDITLKGILDSPLDYLREGEVPEYEVKELVDSDVSQGTKIKIINLKTNNKRQIFWGDKLRNYLRWKTVAGSIRRFFEGGDKFNVTLEISNKNRGKTYTISGHPLPNTNEVEDSDDFAYQFDPFEYKIKNSSREFKVEVVGSIVGPEAHIVKDKRMKKKYKGFFLCKDYFPIRSVNEEVFGNSGEWQSMHVLINCQGLNLTMGREDFLNKDEEGSIFNKIISSLKVFKNSILNGKPFHLEGQRIEETKNYAGKGYDRLRSIKKNQEKEKIDFKRATKIIQKKNNIDRFEDQTLPFAFKPSNRLSTFSLFMTLLGKGSFSKKYKIFDVDKEDDRISILMSHENGSDYLKPIYYTIYKTLNDNLLNNINKSYQGVICWDSNIKNDDISRFDDFIKLKDLI